MSTISTIFCYCGEFVCWFACSSVACGARWERRYLASYIYIHTLLSFLPVCRLLWTRNIYFRTHSGSGGVLFVFWTQVVRNIRPQYDVDLGRKISFEKDNRNECVLIILNRLAIMIIIRHYVINRSLVQ